MAGRTRREAHATRPTSSRRTAAGARSRRRRPRQAVDELAHGLLALGVEKGDSFGILARTRLEWVLLDFALAQIGAIPAPIYPSSTADASAATSSSTPTPSAARRGRRAAREDRGRAPGARLHDRDTRRAACARPRARRGATRTRSTEARAQIGDDDLFTFIYTSGTTGPPKGCMILNRNYYDMVGRIDEIAELLPADATSCSSTCRSPTTSGGSCTCSAPTSATRSRSCPDPRRIGDVMPQVRPTVLPTVPRVLEKVHTAVSANFAAATGVKRRLIDWALGVGAEVSALRQRQRAVPAGLAFKHRIADRLVYSKVKARLGGRLRAAISGGAPLAKEIAEFFHVLDILILEGYGQTEETTASNVNRPNRFKFGTVGPAHPRHRGCDRRGRRDPDQGPDRLRRLLQRRGGDPRRAPRRRVAAHRRRRRDRRGRIPDGHRPQEGHHRHRRRQERRRRRTSRTCSRGSRGSHRRSSSATGARISWR